MSARLTVSEVARALLARNSDRSHVSLTLNAKGDTQIEVVVQPGDTESVPDVLAAERRACEIYDRLRVKYPRTPEPTAAQAEVRKLSAERRRLKGKS